jgi:hypothetical protein
LGLIRVALLIYIGIRVAISWIRLCVNGGLRRYPGNRFQSIATMGAEERVTCMLCTALCTEYNTTVGRSRRTSGIIISHPCSSNGGYNIIGSLNGTEATEGGTSLILYPAILVVRHIAFAAHNDVITGSELSFAIGTNFSGVIIHFGQGPLP